MWKKAVLLILVLVFMTTGSAFAQQNGTILFEWFDGTTGGNLDEATDGRNPDYPDNPSEVDWLTIFQGPSGRADSYMTRVRGYVYPPQTGNYTFWTASDDHSRVYLSTDDDPANTSLICYIDGWTGETSWDEQANQKSAAISMVAGQKYYIEVLQRDGNGGDHLAVGWGGPGIGSNPTVIDGQYLSPFLRRIDLIAANPDPVDGSIYTKTVKSLVWSPGKTADSQDVYFGEDYDAVLNGTPGTFRDNVLTSQNWYLVGYPDYPYPDGLDFGKTYYWRIDSIEADGITRHTGEVWSFTVPPKTAYSPQPADGAEFVDPDTDLTWSPGLNAVIHTVYFGEDYDTVANASGNPPTGMATYDPPGTLEPDTTYYWRVDESEGAIVHKGDVWSFTTIPVISISDPNLLGWWKLDEGMGLTALDWSGHLNHGTLTNGPVWVAEGVDGGALQFDGADDYVDTGHTDHLTTYSVCCWVTSPTAPAATSPTGPVHHEQNFQIDWNHSDETFRGSVAMNAGGTWVAASFGDLQADTWYHLCGTYDGTVLRSYVDGVLITETAAAAPNAESNSLKIARHAAAAQYFEGTIDDVRIYDTALTAEQIQNVMRGDPRLAWNPEPADELLCDILNAKSLAWSPGEGAVKHIVYLGTDEDAVTDADTSSPECLTPAGQTATSYPLAGLVEFGGPSYWRIDEVAGDSTVTKGRIWEFTAADYLIVEDFEDYNDTHPDRVFDSWFDGTIKTKYGNSQVGYWWEQADLEAGEHFLEENTVQSGDWSMPYLFNGFSEARLTMPPELRDWTQEDVAALSLWYRGHPASQGSFVQSSPGAYEMTGAGADIWRPDVIEADEFHYAWKTLQGSGSITALVSAPTGTNMNGWVKAGVMIRETLEPESAHAFMCLTNTQGIAFQFRPDAAGVSENHDHRAGEADRPKWLRLEKDLANTFTAFHANDLGGSPDKWTAMTPIDIQMASPVYIGLALTSHQRYVTATATFSEISTEGNVSGAFTAQDIGIQSNPPQPMYVTIEDGQGRTATVTNPDPDAANVMTWAEWGEYGEGIALSDFVADNANFNLADVNSILIGFGAQSAGSGLMYFDDIRLYRSRCVAELTKPGMDFNNDCVVDMRDLEILTDNWLVSDYEVTPTDPGTAGLLAYYRFENNLLDNSGNANHGDPCGTPDYVAGQTGNSIELDGVSDGVVNGSSLLNDLSQFTLAGWVNAANADESRIGLFGQNDCVEFGFNNGDLNAWTAAAGSVSTPWAFDYPAWHHVALVGDETSLTIYVDGLRSALGGGDVDSYGSSDFGFNVGTGVWDATGNWFSGAIDEVRAYDRALSQEEIASLADRTLFKQPLHLLLTPQDPNMDTDGDGKVNFTDYAGLIDSWLDEILWP